MACNLTTTHDISLSHFEILLGSQWVIRAQPYSDHVYYVNPSTNISVNISTDAQYVGRHIDQHSADVSIDMCRLTDRPTHLSIVG